MNTVATYIPPAETFTNGIKNFDRQKLSLIVLSEVLDHLIFGCSKDITVEINDQSQILHVRRPGCCLDFVLTSPKNYLD